MNHLPRSVLVGGRRWRIEWIRNLRYKGEEIGGLCEAPNARGKTIRFNAGLDDEALVQTIIHEIVHAGCFALDETTTDDIAVAATSLLMKLGFRRITNKE